MSPLHAILTFLSKAR